MTTITDILAAAVRHHQAGNLAQAERLYRQILQINPAEGNALHLLGMLAHGAGQNQAAVELIRQAILVLPHVAEIHSNLAGVYLAMKEWQDAITACEHALRLRPEFPEALSNLGDAYAGQGKLEKALTAFQETLRLKPDDADAHNNLGNVLQQLGRFEQAEASYREALRLRPHDPDLLSNLGAALVEQNRLAEAEAQYRNALRLSPAHADALGNLGSVLTRQGRPLEGEACCRQSLHLRPNSPETLINLGSALTELGDAEGALRCYREAARFGPGLPGAHYMLGYALENQGQFDEAVACYEQAIRLNPDHADALNSLAYVRQRQGLLDEALALYRKAVALKPEVIHNLLFALHYSADYDPAAMFAEHLGWGAIYDALPRLPPRALDANRQRRLRVGYLSGDFREHVMGRYAQAVVQAHDRQQFEVFCYSNVSREDARTERIKTASDHWRSIARLSDDQIADLILQDEIDILVDLAGHTGGNRLEVFARKPAPIQVSHFGYPSSTGLRAIDYRLTDAFCDPPGQTEHLHYEKLVRMPGIQWCYVPWATPDLTPVAAQRSGEVTFGSINNLAKVTEPMMALSARILNQLPASRLLLVSGVGQAADRRICAAFAKYGVGIERIVLVGRQSLDAYLGLIQCMDILLDVYPFTGCNTTADVLWMGVPVVTLAGPTWETRQGLAILSQVGLEDLIADRPEAYVETACRLAGDLARLRELRGQLRERVRRTLGEVPRFTRQLEDAYWGMWKMYLGGREKKED